MARKRNKTTAKRMRADGEEEKMGEFKKKQVTKATASSLNDEEKGASTKNGEEEKMGEFKEKQITTASLNDDIISYIFTKIPADLLWANFRSLSKQWSNLIFNPAFICQNVLQSTQGIIYREDVFGNSCTYRMRFIEFKGTGVIQVHELHAFQTCFAILSSCNGLLFLYTNQYWRHVLNPITKKSFSFKLSRPNSTCYAHTLVFVPSTMNYKVVEFSRKTSKTSRKMPLLLRVYDLHGSTKQVQIPALYDSGQRMCTGVVQRFYTGLVVPVDGVVYWNLVDKGIACFDVSTEAFRLLPYPPWYSNNLRPLWLYQLLYSIGGFLSALEYTCNKINIWILKDDKWVILSSVEINQQHFDIHTNNLLGHLNNGELIVFRDSCSLSVYDTKSMQWTIINDKSKHLYSFYHIHVNSLSAF